MMLLSVADAMSRFSTVTVLLSPTPSSVVPGVLRSLITRPAMMMLRQGTASVHAKVADTGGQAAAHDI